MKKIIFAVSIFVVIIANLVFAEESIKDGVHKEYYENGNLKKEVTYKNGKKDGVSKGYYENGELFAQHILKDGKEEGLSISYFQDGSLRMELQRKYMATLIP